jgi:predicted transcriptional regulator
VGRLRKAKIDQIAKLRSEGYTQAETAEKIGVCLKTVRKYDPESISGSAKEWQELKTLPQRVRKLEEVAKSLSLLALSNQIERIAKDEKYWLWCPKCDSPVEVEELKDKKTKKSYYGCHECGTAIPDAQYFYDPALYMVDEENLDNSKRSNGQCQ